MTTQLSIYNGSLRELGERKLASLTENTEPRRVLDEVYTPAVKFCLEQGHWKFAQRAAKLSYDTGYTAAWGYTYRFAHPTDFVKLSMLCQDEFFNVPLNEYSDENTFWFANLDEIYVSYVSNDTSYGLDLSLWPETFVLFVEKYLAMRIAKRLVQNTTDLDELKKDVKRARLDAMAKDAMAGPTKFFPQGAWVSSRNNGGGRGDRGNRGSLIG